MITIGVLVAAVLTISFDTEPLGYRFTDFVVDGFRFSPMCAVNVRQHLDNRYLNVDRSNNCGWNNNPDWTGNGEVHIDYFGQPFTLLGLSTIAPMNATGGLVARSSKGGFLEYAPSDPTGHDFIFTGDLWTNVLWVSLDELWDRHQYQNGYDNIRVSLVYEPSTLELLGIAFAGLLLFGVTRKLRWQ
jgi:hypothetical protein